MRPCYIVIVGLRFFLASVLLIVLGISIQYADFLYKNVVPPEKSRCHIRRLPPHKSHNDHSVSMVAVVGKFDSIPFVRYRLMLRPRMLRNVSQQNISVTVLGHELSMPICVSPTAYQAMAHPDGELATVRGKLAVWLHCILLCFAWPSLFTVLSIP